MEQANLKQADSAGHFIPPIGFIYIQLPGEMPPQKLWANVTVWLDISPSLAGVFFRVDGGGAEPFGQIQEDFLPNLEVNYTIGMQTSFPFIGSMIPGLKTPPKAKERIQMSYKPTSKENPLLITSAYDKPLESSVVNALMFQWTTGEVHPRNMAIKVWRRMI